MKRFSVLLICLLMVLSITVGYAQISGNLNINGTASVHASDYDIYISDISPTQSGTVGVNGYLGTVIWTSTTGRGSASFTVTVVNASEKTYVYERLMDGNEADIEDVYAGEGVSFTVEGISYLSEVAPNNSISFRLHVTVDANVVANNVYLRFKFMEKTGSEILPGGDNETETEIVTEEDSVPGEEPPVPEQTEPEEIETEEPGSHLHSDMLGLSEALLSSATNCLNDNNIIWNAVQDTIDSKHRPNNMPAMVHCMVTSIPGGNMVTTTQSANRNLKGEVHFVILADETNPNRLFLYMYHTELCTQAAMGTNITTYLQVLSRSDKNSRWDEDGTYQGIATVATMWGGGNKNDYRLTIDPRTWRSAKSGG